MVRAMRRLLTPGCRCGTAKYYQMNGQGLFSGVKRFFSKGRRLLDTTLLPAAQKHLLPVAQQTALNLAPELLTLATSKLGEQASNAASQASQAGARKLSNQRTSQDEKLSPNQKLVSDFISKNSGNLLSSLLAGSGVRGYQGSGVRGYQGTGVISTETPRI
jgi:hypothetical protein